MRRTLIAALLLIASCAFAQNPLRDAARQDGSFAWKIRTEGISICCCEGSTYSKRENYVYQDIWLVARGVMTNLPDPSRPSAEITICR